MTFFRLVNIDTPHFLTGFVSKFLVCFGFQNAVRVLLTFIFIFIRIKVNIKLTTQPLVRNGWLGKSARALVRVFS